MVGGADRPRHLRVVFCAAQLVVDFHRGVGLWTFVLFWYIQFYGVTHLDQGKALFEKFQYEDYQSTDIDEN